MKQTPVPDYLYDVIEVTPNDGPDHYLNAPMEVTKQEAVKWLKMRGAKTWELMFSEYVNGIPCVTEQWHISTPDGERVFRVRPTKVRYTK